MIAIRRIVGLSALVGVSLGSVACCRGDDSMDPKALRVITYNIQFFPDPVSWKNKRPLPEYRARRIAEELRNFDIAGLQEAFHLRHRTLILDQTRVGWNGVLHQMASPHPTGFFINGGCVLLSRRPMLASSGLVFANFSKPEDHGLRADGFAAKGVIHARIARSDQEPDNFIDVFVTHLEARADDLRPLQYKELAGFIQQKGDAARPFLLLGDLNTAGMVEYRRDPASQYAALMRELITARPKHEIIDAWPHLRGTALGGTNEQESSNVGKRIDYIILGNPTNSSRSLRPVSIEVRPYQDEKVGALSDHNAVAAEFDWPTSNPAGPQ